MQTSPRCSTFLRTMQTYGQPSAKGGLRCLFLHSPQLGLQAYGTDLGQEDRHMCCKTQVAASNVGDGLASTLAPKWANASSAGCTTVWMRCETGAITDAKSVGTHSGHYILSTDTCTVLATEYGSFSILLLLCFAFFSSSEVAAIAANWPLPIVCLSVWAQKLFWDPIPM